MKQRATSRGAVDRATAVAPDATASAGVCHALASDGVALTRPANAPRIHRFATTRTMKPIAIETVTVDSMFRSLERECRGGALQIR